ncbi:hypothetical protein, partial [Salmonella enterica]|uniref:hypothetical protein n=1 Tax=Salmonella enterica TaxID=28901 RepID=UPI003297B9FE
SIFGVDSVFAQINGPGGVNTDLVFYLTADAGTGTTTNGASVSTWQDQSTLGNHATLFAGSVKYATNAINSLPALDFSTVNTGMTIANSPLINS